MTCVLLGGIRDGDIRHDVSGGDAAATPILDWGHDDVARLYEDIAEGAIQSAQEFLVSAHRSVAATIRAVYGLDDRQPVSVTLSRGRGSCSQRLAVVEALARRRGIATRVRGLVLRGEFWYPRFRHLRAVIPTSVLLAWPEFLIDGRWQDISEIVAPAAVSSVQPFTNTGEETLFDAIGRAPISWGGSVSCDCLDFSEFVDRDLGTFESRDNLFEEFGQTMSTPVRILVDPVFRNWSASG
ncbi:MULTISPECIES: transglutaminase domain-containing protein [unclassified Rhodococcus (in: high G+C Gram-positive bacteria)]|uniref:transglutaminase domain-containing protein n=1 Tax=unclassified Rhodococcus (in: high G+C Gram-positive bacteria) TaxID=192944 RepID=UPI0024B689C6|nr:MULTISPECIES: transglutaminase domain-containing protein [unclassified Rhodococcus (in: high G+C Gram-positive bacteria)]MDI9956209.1 transglutaminase domain-containing protein [Rhodococcus sp. IEGM 1237]MDI9965640.1 transglutaminase domain-containing protein [Rhodococcus sp. IEGM 1251]MDV8124736.1 transglutaminase domain-containing protein [Rhodococcus sp. IEGM 1304]